MAQKPTEPRRKHISAPYTCLNGKVITCQQHIDEYNRIQDDINAWIDAKRPAPKWLIEWSHRKFIEISEIPKENRNT